jgi:hypothetical protein
MSTTVWTAVTALVSPIVALEEENSDSYPPLALSVSASEEEEEDAVVAVLMDEYNWGPDGGGTVVSSGRGFANVM